MGDAADDAFDAAMREQERADYIRMHDLKPCPHCSVEIPENECPVCHDLLWLDADGNPVDLD